MVPNLKLIFAVLLPVLGLSVGITRGELHGQRAQRFVFDIDGYDPRDLLHGHFLAYRFNLHDEPTRSVCVDDDPDCCLCLRSQPAGMPSQVERVSCTASPSVCAATLATLKLKSLQRYYIPEARAQDWAVKLQEAAARNAAQVVLAIDAEGVAKVEALRLDGQALK